MIQKPTTLPVSEDDKQPVTRGDLSLWGGRLQEQLTELQNGQRRLERGQGKLERGQSRLEQLIIEQGQQIRDHTQALVEELREDLGGAQKNETDLLKEKQADHADRIAALERHARIT